MKILKNKWFIGICIAVPVVAILAVVALIFINEYTIELSVTDGQTIVLEYEKDMELPVVTAIYKGSLFNKEGTEIEVSMDGEIDIKNLGTYNVTYKAEQDDIRESAEVTVIIQDTEAPVITLVTDPDYFTSPVGTYVEEGYSATDNYDGDITDKVVAEEKDGIVTYTVSDTEGNTTTVTRDIVYKDVVAPVITLTGQQEITLSLGSQYADAGCVAVDDVDGDITSNVQVQGEVDVNNYGTYTITYTVEDSSKNVCEVVRKVTVKDLTAPSIKLSGSQSMYIKLGQTFSDPGFSASDNADGDVSAKVTTSGNVDTSKVGTYNIVYQVTDEAGNTSKVTRNVYVYEKQAESVVINPGNKVVYLTFDDGPGRYTEKLLNILDKYGVKVTFFVTNQYPAYQNMIGEAYRRGHTIAMHTYSHQFSIYKSEETYYADLKKIEDICIKQTGVKPTIVRFPGGTSNTKSANYCKGIMSKLSKSLSYHGYLYCDWNVSSGDAGGTTSTKQVAKNVINGMKSHNVSIVLQHDIKGYSVDAVEEIIVWGLANGYTFLPMSESTPMVHHGVNN